MKKLNVIKTKFVQNQIVSKPVNNLLIFDRSGSMYRTLEQVVEDIKSLLPKFNAQDTISIGWFSGEGSFGWIVKGMSVSNTESIRKTLDNYKNTVGTTCFSEIINDLPQIVTDFSTISDVFSLLFFTDGYPVVGNYNKEMTKIFDGLKYLSGKISTVSFVGYGDYYNKDLLSEMANIVGGEVLHADNIHEIQTTLNEYAAKASKATPLVEFRIPKDAELVVGYNNDGFFPIVADKETALVPENTNYISYLSDSVSSDNIEESEKIHYYYSSAAVAMQKGNYTLAMEILASIGDVNFVTAISNSFVPSELGRVQTAVKEAYSNAGYRFIKGKKVNCLPKDDAFSIMDLAQLLMKDEEAKFLPYHPSFKYKSISSPTKNKEGYPAFIKDVNATSPISGFTFHESRFNLSVKATVNGTVELDDDAPNFGLSRIHPTKKHNNYSLIANGMRNVDFFPIKDISLDTIKTLQQNEVPYEVQSDVYILDLRSLPVINKKIAHTYNDLNLLLSNVEKEIRLEGKVKAFKWAYTQLPENITSEIDRFVAGTNLSEAQVAYLNRFGVNAKNEYAPEREQAPSVDFYFAKELSVKVKGVSSLPSINDVQKKIDSKKPLTFRETLVNDGLIESKSVNFSDDKNRALWLKDQIKAMNKELAKLRFDINRSRFAAIVGKAGFPGVDSIDGYTIAKNGIEYTFSFNEAVKVDI